MYQHWEYMYMFDNMASLVYHIRHLIPVVHLLYVYVLIKTHKKIRKLITNSSDIAQIIIYCFKTDI